MAISDWLPVAAVWVALVCAGLGAVGLLRTFGLIEREKAVWLTVALASLSVVGLIGVAFLAPKYLASLNESDEEPGEPPLSPYQPDLHTESAKTAAEADEALDNPPDPDTGLDDLYEYSKNRDD